MAHWIIEDYGFGGQNYRCSNCRESWNDIYFDVSTEDCCPNCHKPINEDETEYIDIPNKHIADNAIIFPQTIGDITFYSKTELFEWVEKQQQINKLSVLSATIPDEIIDKWNSIGCTSFRLTADELKEVVEKEYEAN